MFASTHRLIGYNISIIVNQNYGSQIEGLSFQYGCVIPDIVRPYRNIQHTRNQSFALVTEFIQNLCTCGEPRSRLFSVKLGIVTHFLSDYFCQAHNFSKYQNKLRHGIYENNMARKYGRDEVFNITNRASRLLDEVQLKSFADILMFIDEKHDSYLNEQPSMINDICYSVETALVVVAAIVSHNLALEMAA